ncbi:hypothetical protein ACLM5H_09840 [Fredinandcohnia humi]
MLKKQADNRTTKSKKKQPGKDTTPYHFASYAEVEAEKMKSK